MTATPEDALRVPVELTGRLREGHARLRDTWGEAHRLDAGSTNLQDAIQGESWDGDYIILQVLMEYAPRLRVEDYDNGQGPLTEERALEYLSATTVTEADLETALGPGWAGVVPLVRDYARRAPQPVQEQAVALAERPDLMWAADLHKDDLWTLANWQTVAPAARGNAQAVLRRRHDCYAFDLVDVPEEALLLIEARNAVEAALPDDLRHACGSAAMWALPDEVTDQVQGVELVQGALLLAVMAEAGRHLIAAGQYAALTAPLAGASATGSMAVDDLDEGYELVESVQVNLAYHPGWTNGQMELNVYRVRYESDSPDDYEVLPDGEIFSGELAVPASTAAGDIERGKAEAVEKLRGLGLQLWDDNWHVEGDYAIFNDTKPLT
ncbi:MULTISPECIES: hypothetical protein [Streptomyces]|uniref:Uncharacterized protein n=1 Tax=Streptomyces bacillaris TaxID=68179 RepID=A0ABW6DVH8_9ACTN|nr:hypothetical protein [Streptomyces nanshensis]